MALIPCKECGHKISSSAKNCPNCGAPLAKSSTFGCMFVIFSFVVFGLIVLVTWMNNSGTGASKAVDRPQIYASAQKSLTTLYVTNEDTFTWPSVKIYMNGVFGGYEYQTSKSLGPGETLEVDLIYFTKENGDRFQPLEKDVRSIVVSVPGYDAPELSF